MPTYDPIASITLTSSQTEITFSNLPQIYTDLTLVVAGTHTGSGVAGLYVSAINGDGYGSTFYSRTLLQGNGSSAVSARGTSEDTMNLGLIGSVQTNSTFHFMNYSNNYLAKTILARGNDSSSLVRAAVGTYFYGERPITSFTLTGVTFAAGTTFNLYGIGANQLKATGGDIITTDGTYWYHAFTKSGTFTPLSTLSCDYLVIAGGGGGARGAGGGGGGGAGGLRTATSQSLTALTGYTVTVGAGGAGGVTGTAAFSGSNSVFNGLTSAGGGRGAADPETAATGGSGGGGSLSVTSGAAGNTPSTSPSQGNAGGNFTSAVDAYGGGGGGGAGAAGSNGTSTAGGNGGAGVNTYSTWLNTTNTGINGFIAGGGGGGRNNVGLLSIGGSGGGGNGGGNNTDNATAGTANTGGGGGAGGGGNNPGKAGGSGLVIVRYAV